MAIASVTIEPFKTCWRTLDCPRADHILAVTPILDHELGIADD